MGRLLRAELVRYSIRSDVLDCAPCDCPGEYGGPDRGASAGGTRSRGVGEDYDEICCHHDDCRCLRGTKLRRRLRKGDVLLSDSMRLDDGEGAFVQDPGICCVHGLCDYPFPHLCGCLVHAHQRLGGFIHAGRGGEFLCHVGVSDGVGSVDGDGASLGLGSHPEFCRLQLPFLWA